MRTRFFLLLLVCTLPLSAAPKLWGKLEPGPYAVGFRVLQRYDASRPFRAPVDLEGKPVRGNRARPMQISVWYPAEATKAARMKFADYVALVASTGAGQDERAFWTFPLIRQLTPAQAEQWKAMETYAVRDAKPLARKFPLVVWSLHWPALSHVTPEYLASHGYVVVTMPRIGPSFGAPTDNRDADDLETKLRDIHYLLGEMATFRSADMDHIGAVGFSAGGRWMAALAMENPDVRAVVSLDSILLFDDPAARIWRTMPFYDLGRVRIPVLHLIRPEFASQEKKELWEQLRYADRTYVEFPAGLDHLDFQSVGYATTLVGARADVASEVARTFDTFNRDTLAFLDAHVKGETSALAQIQGKHLAAEPAPPTVAQWLETLQANGVDAALAAVRAGKLTMPEQTVNLVGYTLLLAQNRPADAARIFALNTEAFPQSANAHDSLADALEAAGETQAAIDESEKALALLEQDSMPGDRKALVRQNIEDKLKRLKR